MPDIDKPGKTPNSRLRWKVQPLYYGWMIVITIFLSSLASAAQINPTIGVFLKPITEEFDWTRSTVAGAVAIGTLAGGFTALGVGPLIDRFGARWILFTSFLFSGIALSATGAVETLWQLYVTIFVSRVALQGVINLTNQTVVTKWFVRQRGRAVAIANLGQRLGGGAIPFFSQHLISWSSWRFASIVLGILVWILTLFPVAFWLRRQPQDMGLMPDGDQLSISDAQNNHVGKPSEETQIEESYDLQKSLRTRPFWVILGAFCLTNFVNTGVNFNLMPHLTDKGLADGQAATILLVWALATIPSTLGLGILAERLSVRHLMIITSAGVGLGILILLLVNNFALGLWFALLHGASFSGSILLLQLILANYYGSASLGSLRGFIIPWQMTANAVGPLAGTLVYDITGSYNLIFGIYIALQAALVLALLLIMPSYSQWVVDRSTQNLNPTKQ